MKTDSFCTSRRAYKFDSYVTTVPAIKVGSVFIYKYQGIYQILHKNGLTCFWLSKATKDQAIAWAKRELIQRIGNMHIDLECSQFTSEIKREFKDLFNYSIFWGVNSWNDIPSELTN